MEAITAYCIQPFSGKMTVSDSVCEAPKAAASQFTVIGKNHSMIIRPRIVHVERSRRRIVSSTNMYKKESAIKKKQQLSLPWLLILNRQVSYQNKTGIYCRLYVVNSGVKTSRSRTKMGWLRRFNSRRSLTFWSFSKYMT